MLGVTRPPVEEMFDDVYKDRPWHLDRQLAEVLEAVEARAARASKTPDA